MPLRVGLVGTAHIARYADAFRRIDNCTLAALCAPPKDERRSSVAKTYAIPALYAGVEEMLDKAQLDLVVVSSPPAQHRAHVCAALEAGCHVLCAHPPATSAEDAQVCYYRALYTQKHLQYGPDYRLAQNLPPPRPHLSTLHVRWRRTTASDALWARDIRQSGGGALADLGVHAIDTALYALGDPPVERVSGTMHDAGGITIQQGAEDAFVGLLQCAGGRRISLEVSWIAERDEQAVVAYGDAPHAPPLTGKVEDELAIRTDEDLYWRGATQFMHHAYVSNRARQLEITHRAVLLQQVLDGLYASARSGQPVRLV